jgi:hypothetical protein
VAMNFLVLYKAQWTEGRALLRRVGLGRNYTKDKGKSGETRSL